MKEDVDPGRSHLSGIDAWPPPSNVLDHLTTLGNEISRLLPGGLILDVGCGDGSLSRLLADARPDCQIVSVDIEPHDLWRVDEGRSNLIHCIASVLEMPFASRSFDAVVIKDVLHHVSDPRAAFENVSALARQRVVVIEANRYNPISYVWMVRLAKHEHFSRKRLRWVTGVDRFERSIETHVWPHRLARLGRRFDSLMNRIETLESLRNYNLVVRDII